MNVKLAVTIVISTTAIFFGSLYSGTLHASQYAEEHTSFDYSIIGNLIKWVTTSQSDFECSGLDNRSHVDTWSSPGDVMLDKKPAWISWWNYSWRYRMLINVKENSGSELIGYQVLINLTSKNFNYSRVNADGSDIRFTLYNQSSDNESLLSYWIEEWNTSGESKIWVRISKIPANRNATLYMYYGNPDSLSMSDGDKTFEFFDDFEDGDISDWSEYGNGNITVVDDGGNKALLKTDNNDPNGGYSLFNHGAIDNFEVVFRTKRVNENGGPQNRYGIENGSFNGYGVRMQRFDGTSRIFGIESRTAGYGTTIASTNFVGNHNVWYKVKFRKYGSNLEFKLYDPNGSLVQSVSAVDSSYNSFDRFVVHGGYEFYTDDIIVRKYVDPEPTVNMGAEQSQKTWVDYFGGSASIDSITNAIIEKGDVKPVLTSSIHKYDFSSGGGTDRWAYKYQANTNPPSANNIPSIEFGGYANISADDGIMEYDFADTTGFYATHRFDFKISENKGNITGINVLWNGIGRSGGWLPGNDGATLYLWNFSSGSYEEFATSLSAGEIYLTANVSSIENFVNSTGHIIVLVEQNTNAWLPFGFPLTLSRLWTDCLCLNISLRNISIVISVPISPSNIIGWNKFYANATIFPGTNIVYKILNASNNATICNITAAEAGNGYNISFISADSIKLYAELMTNNSSVPFLHEWGVSWYSGYYSDGYFISCFHDSGNATYVNISWNATLPAGTEIKFQISSSPDNINWTEFLGPDGSNATYYNISGTSIWGGHNGDRYIKYRAYIETSDSSKTPILHDVTITYYGG